jgi:hypothetical protein
LLADTPSKRSRAGMAGVGNSVDIRRSRESAAELHWLPLRTTSLAIATLGPALGREGFSSAKPDCRRELSWHYLVRQARRRLVDLGLVDGSRPGLWGLTAVGRQNAEWIAAGKVAKIDVDIWGEDEEA